MNNKDIEFNSGDMIYIAQMNPLAGVAEKRYYCLQHWCNSGHQREYVELGIAFKCKEDAERKTKELLGIIEGTKPIFTQEMADKGVAPSKGMLALIEDPDGTEYYKIEIVDYYSKSIVLYWMVGATEKYEVCVASIGEIFPYKTPHEKLVDSIAKELSHSKAETTHVVTNYDMFKSDAEWLVKKFEISVRDGGDK